MRKLVHSFFLFNEKNARKCNTYTTNPCILEKKNNNLRY